MIATGIVLALMSSAGPEAPGRDPAADALRGALTAALPGAGPWALRRLGGTPPAVEADLRVGALGARTVVRALVRTPAGAEQWTTHWFSVQGQREVWVAAERLPKGTRIAKAPMARGTAPVFGTDCRPVDEPADAEDRVLRRELAPGTPLCHGDLVERPAVARGDRVSVVAARGPVTLAAIADAEENGNTGAVIRVRNPHTRDVYRAVVTGPRQVRVDE